MMTEDVDSRVRLAAFKFLDEQTRLHGPVLPHEVLLRGFLFEGSRVPLWSPQGIHKPAILPEMPLTIWTAPEVRGRPRPYDDEFGRDGVLYYRYQGTNPMNRDNVGLRLAMERRIELIYLFGIEKGRYQPIWPVRVIHEDRERLSFIVDAAAAIETSADPYPVSDPGTGPIYAARTIQQRIQQQRFSTGVLRAYHERCAICRLHHRELLEAAHILPYGHPRGASIVPNGLALCRLHHAAFDAHFLGIRSDLVIQVSARIMDEKDGPMLVHGLQGFNDERIHVPRPDDMKPRREFLEERYEIFRKAG